MARILDVTQSISPSRVEKQAIAPRDLPTRETDGGEESEVPFIEVGAGVSAASSRVDRRRGPHPAIIPLPRVRAAEETAAASHVPLKLFRIAFQPLPFPESSSSPPAERYAPELITFHDPQHEISQQYRQVAEQIRLQLADANGRTLFFTSTGRRAGTTSFVLNLAMTFSSASLGRILVVDANWDHPAVAARLGLAPEPGLREILARTVPLVWALKESGTSCLSILPAGSPSLPVTMDLWPIVLDQLTQQFDWLLIDGPLVGSSGWPALAGTAQAAYLVWKSTDLENPQLNHVLGEMSRSAVPLRGYILTQS